MFLTSNQPEAASPASWQRRPAAVDLHRKSGNGLSPAVGMRATWADGSDKSRRWLSNEEPSSGPAPARGAQSFPAEIGFLLHYGIAPSVLAAAAADARAQGVTPDAAILTGGKVSEYHFYRSLARHLRLTFVDGQVALGPAMRYPQSINTGLAPLPHHAGQAFLAAPRGAAIAYLTAAVGRGADLSTSLALTTPTHLSQLVREAAREPMSRAASMGLSSFDPSLCVRGGASPHQRHAASTIVAVVGFLALMTPAASLLCEALLSLAFIAIIWLRLTASAASLTASAPRVRPLRAGELPVYSIVIALYREARVVPQLLAALNEIDYPRAKLDIKFVIEEDDRETLSALSGAGHRPGREILLAPAGLPRTKPRALNVALPLVRGQFVAVFDAEDVPDPLQIKMAAQRFASAPEKLACLQARLAIDNTGDGWLARLFAIEYAALFDVINVGFGALRLPFPLGGSSNHFRTDILRKIGGWDAWN